MTHQLRLTDSPLELVDRSRNFATFSRPLTNHCTVWVMCASHFACLLHRSRGGSPSPAPEATFDQSCLRIAPCRMAPWAKPARGTDLSRVRSIPRGDVSRIMHMGSSGPFPASRNEAKRGYSTISLARRRSDPGTFRPSTFAVLRLMTSSNFVGC